jgi:hypothetical protein
MTRRPLLPLKPQPLDFKHSCQKVPANNRIFLEVSMQISVPVAALLGACIGAASSTLGAFVFPYAES